MINIPEYSLHDDSTTFLVARYGQNARRQQEEASVDESSQGGSSMRIVETVYFLGAIFGVVFIIFNLIRNRCLQLYNPRQQVAPCELSSRRWIPFAWMGSVARITDEELVDQASEQSHLPLVNRAACPCFTVASMVMYAPEDTWL
jgi:hypothetical protein